MAFMIIKFRRKMQKNIYFCLRSENKNFKMVLNFMGTSSTNKIANNNQFDFDLMKSWKNGRQTSWACSFVLVLHLIIKPFFASLEYSMKSLFFFFFFQVRVVHNWVWFIGEILETRNVYVVVDARTKSSLNNLYMHTCRSSEWVWRKR